MKQSPDGLVSFEKRLMKDVFRVWSVTNILEWRVAPRGRIVTQQVLLVLLTVGGHSQKTAETWSQTGAITASNESCLGRKQDKRSRKAGFF